MFIARVMCGLTSVTIIALCYDWSLLCISKSDWATENEAGWSVNVNGNEETWWRDLSPIQFSCDCNYSLITHNKNPVHSTRGLLRVCAACWTPRLNLSSELRPSWKKYPRYVPHRVRTGYSTATIWEHEPENNFTLLTCFGIFNFTSRKNSYLCASLLCSTYSVQQPRHLSYRGTSFSVPFWQTSVPWVINHRVTNVSFSCSPLTPRAGQRWQSFGDESHHIITVSVK